MPEVSMPRLSDSMEEGTIVRWLVEEGTEVSRGEEIVEIETDKATMTYEADADGAISFVAAEGDTLPIGETIATIGGNGAGPKKQEPKEAEKEEPEAEETEAEEPEAEAEAAEEEPKAEAEPEREEQPQRQDGERIKASPVARRIAQEKGLDLKRINGSGPGGRIVKKDVEGAEAEPEREPEKAPAAKGETTFEELSRTQQVIARRMAESKATVPDFTLTVDVDMEEAYALRARMKDVTETVPSFNDFIVKAAALALREYPRANGSYKDGRFELHDRVNVGVAVAAQNALIVPTIFDADQKSLGEIARTSRELAGKAREGKVSPPELGGGTFTVSNLGMFGITHFSAIINPPQAAILAVGAIEQRPVVNDEGELVAGRRMTMTLSCDHRILYGADAAEFLARIRALLEQPLLMAL